MTSDDRARHMDAARSRAELTVQDLWLRYLALGGTRDAFDLDGYLQELTPLDDFQQDVLAQSLNEALADLYRAHRIPLSGSTGNGAEDTCLPTLVAGLLEDRPSSRPDADESEQGRC